MTDIPNNVIALIHVKHIVQCHGEFIDTEGTGQVSTGLRDTFQYLPSQFVRQLFQLTQIEAFHIGRCADLIQERFTQGSGVRWSGRYGIVVIGGCALLLFVQRRSRHCVSSSTTGTSHRHKGVGLCCERRQKRWTVRNRVSLMTPTSQRHGFSSWQIY